MESTFGGDHHAGTEFVFDFQGRLQDLLQEFTPARILAVDLTQCWSQGFSGFVDVVAVPAARVVAEINQTASRRVAFECEDCRWIDLLAEPSEPLRLGNKFFKQTGDVTAGGLTSEADGLTPIGWGQLGTMKSGDQ